MKNIGENLARSVTGSVDKAILCVKKPDWNKSFLEDRDPKTNALTGVRFDLSGATKSTSLQMDLAKLAKTKRKKKAIDKMAEEVSSQSGGMFTFGAAIEEKVKENGYQIFKVKYNPSKIQINSRAGSFIQRGPGDDGTNNISQNIMPAQTFMNFEILLDEENHQDAFMFDKATNITAGSVASNVASVVKNLTENEGYTVRPLVEALIGIMTQEETRHVVFFWGEMAFAGEVVSIDAKYTMFNTLGNPIRAVVRFTLRQGSDEEVDETYWEEAFDNMGDGGSGWQGKVNNLLNFR